MWGESKLKLEKARRGGSSTAVKPGARQEPADAFYEQQNCMHRCNYTRGRGTGERNRNSRVEQGTKRKLLCVSLGGGTTFLILKHTFPFPPATQRAS